MLSRPQSEMHLLRQEDMVKTPNPNPRTFLRLSSWVKRSFGTAGDPVCAWWCGGDGACVRAMYGELQAGSSVGSEGALSILRGLSLCCRTYSPHHGELIPAGLTTHRLWPKRVTLCQSPCAHPLLEAALLSQPQLKIKS